MQVTYNSFCERHTKESNLSHSNLSLNEVARLFFQVDDSRDGYPPENYEEGGRAIVITLPEGLNKHFLSGICLIEEGEEVLEGMRRRIPEEDPRPYREVLRDEKPEAKLVELVFYNSLALSLTGHNSLPPEADNWELISINAYPDLDNTQPPITPYALKANFYGWDGGTPTSLTQEEYDELLAQSEAYWNPRAHVRVRSSKED